MSRAFSSLLLLTMLAGCSAAPHVKEKKTVRTFSAPEVIDLSIETKKRRTGFENAPRVGPVSLLALIANPERYHGKRVTVTGYARVEFEGQWIFSSKDLAIDSSNGIWLDSDFGHLPADQRSKEFPIVIVDGVFDAGERGHLGAGSGSLCLITRFMPMRDP